MDICRWHGKAAARVEVRDNSLALGEKTALSSTQDFYHGNVNGHSDVLWNGSTASLTRVAAVKQRASGTNNGLAANAADDFNGDGKSDILWRHASGDTVIWFTNGLQYLSNADLGNVSTSWSIVGTGDFNGDGKGDILWRNTNGDVAIWLMNGV